MSRVTLALLLTLTPCAGAHDPPALLPRRVPDEEAHRPTPLPDRIVLNITTDPARSVSVTWRTDITTTHALARLAVAQPGPQFDPAYHYAGRGTASPLATTHPAQTTLLLSDLGPAHYHALTFTNLRPDTPYVYSVGDGVNWSEWLQFRTASAQAEPFSFIYVGDAQNDIKAHWSRVIRGAYSAAPHAKFILHAGDLINTSNTDHEWGEWFQAGGWLHAQVPCVPVAGNHEYFSDFNHDPPGPAISRHWRPQFMLPENGLPGLEESVYFFDCQGVRVIVLNSNERLVEQVTWLQRVLQTNPNRWTVLSFHHPLFSAAAARDNAELRNLWLPLIEQYRVDLVLQGHDHTYARSDINVRVQNVPGGAQTRTVNGTMFVVSVSGPKMYHVEPHPWMRKSAEGMQLYQIIHVDGGTLRYTAHTADGAVYDVFTLKKRPGQPNELIEGAPPPTTAPLSTATGPNIGTVLLGLLGAWLLLVLRQKSGGQISVLSKP
jgi:3',5'-cyclic AMP phosphodiesterase CpdA